jgi:L-asparaginase II
VHLVDVAVSDERGRLVASAGDPAIAIYSRSCMKPLQASVALDAIDDDRLSDRAVAVMCSSHNGEPVHVAEVRRILRRAGLTTGSLQCPPAYPFDVGAIARTRAPAPVLSDCSGKHAGMLLASASSGWGVDTYPERGHPLQRRIRRAVVASTGEASVRIGVDGCGVPVFGLPLAAMATLYARLARPDRLGALAPRASRCVAAMRAEPYLVGGRDRADTALMRAAEGVVAKEGAEALFCAAVLDEGIGVAVKVADGGFRAAPPALLSVLRTLGVLPRGSAQLEPLARPVVRGGGRPVGRLVAEVDLRFHR